MRSSIKNVLVLLALVPMAWAAHAQTTVYTCKREGVGSYRSASPCPRENNALVHYGPRDNAYTPPAGSSPLPAMAAAGEELKYLSARCSSMAEGLRTGPAMGVKSDTLHALRREFVEKCGDEYHEAWRRLHEEKAGRRKAEIDARQQARQQSESARKSEETRYAHCAEMRHSIANRKARPQLTEGEQKDLARIEERYQALCRRQAGG